MGEHNTASCILYENDAKTVILVDIPRSLELAQVTAGHPVEKRVVSSSPVDKPWQASSSAKQHEDKSDSGGFHSQASQINELMTMGAIRDALDQIHEYFSGPWCLERVCGNSRSQGCNITPEKASQPETENLQGFEESVGPLPPCIPPSSNYLQDSIQKSRAEFLQRTSSKIFDLIVMDPPWPSRSVRRKKHETYDTVYNRDEMRGLLSLIPVASHLKDEGLVAVWITNKSTTHDLLTSRKGIFAQWDVELVSEWIWLKVTERGAPVVDLDSRWRKPWERLLIAQKRGHQRSLEVPRKVILGVPDLHSRKPNLRQLFDPLLQPGYQGLEIFARNLTAGWWAWGNQVLMFQKRSHWVWLPDDTHSSPKKLNFT